MTIISLAKRELVFLLLLSLSTAAAAQQAPQNVPKIIHSNGRYTWSGAMMLNSLDVYSPVNATHHPSVIFIHAGGWLSGNKNRMDFKPDFYAGNDYVLFSIDYRLSPADRHLARVQDVDVNYALGQPGSNGELDDRSATVLDICSSICSHS